MRKNSIEPNFLGDGLFAEASQQQVMFHTLTPLAHITTYDQNGDGRIISAVWAILGAAVPVVSLYVSMKQHVTAGKSQLTAVLFAMTLLYND